MKNIINYYYGLNLDSEITTNDNSNFYFKSKNNLYCFSKLNLHEVKRITELYNSYSINSKFHGILLNKKGNLFSVNMNDYYILMRIKVGNNIFSYTQLINYYKELWTMGLVFNLSKINWPVLWRIKIDYLEYYVQENQSINSHIKCLCNYFIGVSENAIMLINTAMQNYKDDFYYEKVTFCHERIKKDYTLYDLYNPKNILVDHYSRDISEYLKTLIFCENYNDVLENIIDKINFTKVGYILLLARTMFPTFFYDMLNNIDESSFDDRDLIKIYDYINKYESLISRMYLSISKKVWLPKINWFITKN